MSATRPADLSFDGIIFGLQSVGGISTYAYELYRRLSGNAQLSTELVLPSHMQSVYGSRLCEMGRNIVVERLSPRLSRYLGIGGSAGVFHSTYYRLPARRDAKYVVTVYDFIYEKCGNHGALARMIHTGQKKRALQRADLILCISENTRRDLLELYPHIDQRIVRVTQLGVDRGFFGAGAERDESLARSVLFVGGRDSYKRFDLALRAVARAGLELAIIGSGLAPAEVALLQKELPSRWRHLGRLDENQLRCAYSSAFALMLPSDYEGFGLPILEAQASGCPVVTASTSSLPEVAGGGACLAASQDADEYAAHLVSLQDAELRSKLVETGKANAAGFDWDRLYETTMRAIADVVL